MSWAKTLAADGIMGTQLGGTPSALPSSEAEETASQPREAPSPKGRDDAGEEKDRMFS